MQGELGGRPRPATTGLLTADQSGVRRQNLAAVLVQLRRTGGRSRAGVAVDTGLNKATVSSLVTELLARGLVREEGTLQGATGRPGRVLVVDDTDFVALGAVIDVEYVSVLALNLRGEALTERRVGLDTVGLDPVAVLTRLAAAVGEVLDPLVDRGAVPVGLTLAVPGVVDPASGVVVEAPNLGWHDTAVLDPLRDLLAAAGSPLGTRSAPLDLDNEANLAAVAELDVRRTAGTRDLLLVTGATGVGGGIVSGGRLLRGGRGFAGELGHMQVDPAGRLCRCGRVGCWETVVGLGALLDVAAASEDPVRDPSVDVVERLAVLRARAVAGDADTLRALDRVGDGLVRGCASLVNLLDPDVVVLGGYFAALGPWFADRLERDLPGQVFAPRAGLRVEPSTLGFSAAVRGGALRTTRRLFTDPTLVPVRRPARPLGELAGATA